MAGIDRQLRILPPSLRQIITFDPGTEFAAFLILREKLGMASYFCLTSAPWQTGSAENNNGRIRRFLTLATYIAAVYDNDLQALVAKINNKPRKCHKTRNRQKI